jgi:LacI family transcriptional regulator
MVTMTEVAAKAGVSQATVSFVLGGRADGLKISQETRERVIGAARELGYQRNQLARAMVTGKSRIIGVMTVPDSTDNIIRIMTGAMETANQQDYLLKVLHLSWNAFDEETVARCLEWRLAGVMLVGFSEEVSSRLHNVLREHNIPVTMIDIAPQLDWGARICSDDEQGIRSVVSHLVGLGHRRIAFLGGRPGLLSTWREESFRAAMADTGLTVPGHWVRHTSWGNQPIIETEVQKLFQDSGDTLPTAVVCAADTVAMVVQRIARSRGLRLPGDLSITGYSNANLSAFADPPLTTVDQSFQEMGSTAAQHVIRLAEGAAGQENNLQREMLIPTRLIERGSTAPPPDGDTTGQKRGEDSDSTQ